MPYPPMATVKASGGRVADTTNGRWFDNGEKWVVGADIDHHGDRVFFSKSGKRRSSEEQHRTASNLIQ